MEISRNLNYVIIALFGYLVFGYADWTYQHLDFHFPTLWIITIYFLVAALLLKRFNYVQFLVLSFLFVSIYLKYVNCPVNATTIECFARLELPALIYMLVLLPFIFMSMTIDFYALTFELKNIKFLGIFKYLIPILIRRELVLHRYNLIMDALRAKGYNTETNIGRFTLMPKWIIPLVITTLMEGVESYEYNTMLKTNILVYQPAQNKYYASRFQLILLVLILGLLVLLFLLKWKII